ncbi:MAG: hypothetical protein L0Y57_10785, partial [Beijerinckiaceae bacterium]|nr:hypothetical protein [Beijerinckiaceae bacterium]
MPDAQSEQLKRPSDRPPENFSRGHINSFSEQSLGVSNQNTRNVFIVFDFPAAKSGYQIAACQKQLKDDSPST